MQNRLSLFTKFYTHHTRFLFVPNPNVVRSLVERRSTPRTQIWPTQKFWCGAPMLTIVGSIFIRLAVIASETQEMSRNSKRI